MRNEKGTEYRSDRFICHMCWNSGFLLWNLRSTEESAQEIIPEVQPEPMSEQSVSDSDVSGNSAENSADLTELPEKEESEPVETEDPVEQRAEELLAGMTLEEKVGQMFIARCPETDAASKVTQYHLGGYILFARDLPVNKRGSNRQPFKAIRMLQKCLC